MYRNTRFSELLKELSHQSFNRLVEKRKTDKYNKGFNSWDHLVAMIYGHLSGARSLRELETGFNTQSHHHYHLNTHSIKRSTLADANAKRDCQLFGDLCEQLLQQANRRVRRRFEEKLYLIDSTPIPLKGLGYEWTQGCHSNRTHGLKVHLVIAPQGAVPVQAQITGANVNDVEIGREIKLQRGATYVFDKGYCDYNWWFKVHQNESYFVTRLKKNAGVELSERRRIPKAQRELILEDNVIEFKNQSTSGGRPRNRYYGTALRQVVVKREDKKTPLVLVTNDMERSAQELAALYKQRWDIELFFKWMKQNLKMKQFLGRSENAVRIQIYCAIISYLLASIYRSKMGMKESLRMCMVLLRTDLFSRPGTLNQVDKRRKEHRERLRRLQPELCF